MGSDDADTRNDGVRVSLAYDHENPPEALIAIGGALAEIAELTEAARASLLEQPINLNVWIATAGKIHRLSAEVAEAMRAVANGDPWPPPPAPWEAEEDGA